jgi:hypothetical protein
VLTQNQHPRPYTIDPSLWMSESELLRLLYSGRLERLQRDRERRKSRRPRP